MSKINLKKKVGPLPIWGWAVGGAGTLAVIYYLYKRNSSSSSTAAQTDAQLAAEQQAAQDAANGTDSAGAGAGDTSPTLDTTGLATGSVSTDQLESDLETLQNELATLSLGTPTTDTTPSATIASEAQDLLNAQAALQALGFGQTPAAPKGATSAAKGKLTHLPILAQLQDLQLGLVNKSQLGPNAANALKAANGNVGKAIAQRKHATPPTRHITISQPKPPRSTHHKKPL